MTSAPTGLTENPPASPTVDETFRSTRWTQVRRAKADSPAGRRALGELCEAYYEPVVAFLRCEFRDADLARDVAHDFFAQVLGGNSIANADQERGRFRSYLLGAVKHFLGHRREAAQRLKRGGGRENISLYDTAAGVARTVPDASAPAPDAAFDRQWAVTVVARALDALREECGAEGRAEFFEQAKPWLTGEAAHGDQIALAARCGLNANALKVAVHRLKRRFRQLLQAEVAGTLEDPALVDAELQSLFAALSR